MPIRCCVLPLAPLHAYCSSFDTNRDGAVDYDEFKTGVASLTAQPSEPEYSSFFYEAGNEAEEASSSSAPALEASGTILATTLVRLVIFAGRRPTQMYGRTLSS